MNTPGYAMLWQIWRRHRWFLIMEAAYLLVAAAAVPFLPEILSRLSMNPDQVGDAGVHLCFPFVWVAIHFIGMFVILEAQITDIGFPPRTFVLPVRTRSLVLWPMFFGSVAVSGLWMLIALLILRPTGHNVPLIWPAAAGTMILIVMQTLSWLPLAQGWMRALLLIPVLGTILLVLCLMLIWQTPFWLLLTTIVGTTTLFATIGVRTVGMARRGDAFDWQMWERFVAWLASWRKPAEHPFASTRRAQLWFECRQYPWFGVLFLAFMIVLVVVMTVLIPPMDRMHRFDAMAAVTRIGVGVFFASLWLSGLSGSMISKYSLMPFLAVRPMSSMTIARGKFAMAAVSTVVTWAIVAAVLGPLMFLPSFHGMFRRIAEAVYGANAGAIGKAIGMTLLFVALLMVLTWVQTAKSMWINLTGRQWVTVSLSSSTFVLLVIGGATAGWLHTRQDAVARALALLPWIVGMLLCLKFAAAIWAMLRMRSRRMLQPLPAIVLFGLWCLAVAGLCILGYWIIPTEYLSWGWLIAAALLLPPIARLAATPLAIDWNRHR